MYGLDRLLNQLLWFEIVYFCGVFLLETEWEKVTTTILLHDP